MFYTSHFPFEFVDVQKHLLRKSVVLCSIQAYTSFFLCNLHTPSFTKIDVFSITIMFPFESVLGWFEGTFSTITATEQDLDWPNYIHMYIPLHNKDYTGLTTYIGS